MHRLLRFTHLLDLLLRMILIRKDNYLRQLILFSFNRETMLLSFLLVIYSVDGTHLR